MYFLYYLSALLILIGVNMVVTLSVKMGLILKRKEHRGWWHKHTHTQIRTPPTDGDNKQWLACEKQHSRGVSKQMPVPLLAMLISLLS